MPMYEYENPETGERREVFAAMKDAPPFKIGFKQDGSWVGAPDDEALRFIEIENADDPLKSFQHVSPWWKRVYTAGAPIVREYGVEYAGQKLPVSRALPLNTSPAETVIRNGQKVRKHGDGSYSDLQGRRIISGKKDVERAEAATGFKRD